MDIAFSSSESSIARKRIKKRVSFAPSTKRHDGLNPVSALLQNMVLHHLSFSAFASPRDLLTYLSKGNLFQLLPAVLARMHNLLHRLSQSHAERGVKLLPNGGGKVYIRRFQGTQLLALYKVCCQTDKCLRKYVHRRRLEKSSCRLTPREKHISVTPRPITSLNLASCEPPQERTPSPQTVMCVNS